MTPKLLHYFPVKNYETFSVEFFLMYKNACDAHKRVVLDTSIYA